MEAIRQWATSVCFTVIIVAIFSMLVPKGSMEKVVKFTVSIFFLISLLYPILTNIKDFDINVSAEYTPKNQDTSDLKQVVNQKILDITKAKLIKRVEQDLNAKEIYIKKIDLIINISEDNSILISKISIILDSSYKNEQSKINKIVKEDLGKEPEIIYTNK